MSQEGIALNHLVQIESTIEEGAKKALVALKDALSAKKPREELLRLAQDVEDAQKDEKKEFTVQDFRELIESEISLPEDQELPHGLRAETILERVYETGNETLIDGAELLLYTIDGGLAAFALTPLEKENIKIGLLGYIFDHYYEVLGGIKLSDLGKIFTDMTQVAGNIGKVTQSGNGIRDTVKKKWEGLTGLFGASTNSLGKVTDLLNNTTSIEEKVQKHITEKFAHLFTLLEKRRPLEKGVPNSPDPLSGFLSDPENILNFTTRFPHEHEEELEGKIINLPTATQEKTATMVGKLKTVFENKTALLDRVTGTGKNILDMFANSTDTVGPMAWGRDVMKSILSFLANIPFVGSFVKKFLGLDANEGIEGYFSPERQFQRLSLTNLKKSPPALLADKKIANITTKRLMPFLKAYFPVSSEGQPLASTTWSMILDQHQLPIVRDKKEIVLTIPPTYHITEDDFREGKPGQTFFEKINNLALLITGEAPLTPVDEGPVASKKTPESQTPQAPEIPQNRVEIEKSIFSFGEELLRQYTPHVASMEDGAPKKQAISLLDKIGKNIQDKDIPLLEKHLGVINENRSSFTPLQLASLDRMFALIEAWKNAPKDIPASPPEKTGSQTTKVSEKPDKSTLDKKIDGAITQVRSWLSQAETWLGSQQKK